MSDSTTNLDLLAPAQASPDVTVNALFDAMSANALFGRRASTTAALTWGYYGGKFQKVDGTIASISNGTVALSASATNYLYVDSAGVVQKVTSAPSGWPAPLAADAIALYAVVTDASGVTSYTDYRTRLRGPAGPTGATGPAGAAGATGATGATGAAGTNGSVWRDGSGAPSNSLGANGDYYLNDANGDVYLKSGGTYSVVTNIKGAAGTAVLTSKGDFLTHNGTTAVRQAIGANGELIIADSTQPTGWRWGAPASGGGSLGAIADAQIFSSSGTWTKPANVSVVLVVCLGAGGGGGGGFGGAAGVVRIGGSGGGGGCLASAMYRAIDLPPTVAVTVGAGGSSGAGGGSAAGANGGAGGNSSFGSFLFGYGGGGGFGGIAAASGSSGGSGGGSGGAGTTGNSISVMGGNPATAVGVAGISGQGGGGLFQNPGRPSEYGGGGGGGTQSGAPSSGGGSSIYGGPGGGGGGSITAANVATNGGAGGGFASYTHSDGAPGATGSAGAPGTAGTAGDSTKCGTGGGGGASNLSGTGGAGGAGGINGAGGGGGGGGTSTGGAGGAGGRGAVYVWSW